jgi:hypothetical protein
VRHSCLARNGRRPGEESLTAAIEVQAIEAQSAFGQINPIEARCSRALNSILETCPRTIGSNKKPAFPSKEKKGGRAERWPLVAAQTKANKSAPSHRIVVC